jgi:hypothetical protein
MGILSREPTKCNSIDFALDLDSRVLASIDTNYMVDGSLVDHNVLVAVEIFLEVAVEKLKTSLS